MGHIDKVGNAMIQDMCLKHGDSATHGFMYGSKSTRSSRVYQIADSMILLTMRKSLSSNT